ncbi:hypothetical protein QBC35DRAFT_437446 [Podospora australis]|uniref:Uncharacterized protein n=1 Tax=Podospora australis TaxID=1536484 RepID=A0AAN7AHZ8_9PEZI|nr:hypothetical protein QBC35DRAFT_437446 [Podospora australis]
MKKGKAKKTSVPKKEKTDREIVWWLKFEDKDDTADVKGQKSERESLREEGKFVDRNGVAVWRKKKRFRGSGSIEMLDDPIRHGWELAFAEDELASDSWREKRVARHAPQENWNVTDLRYDLGEREEGFRLEDIVHHEPNYYTVKMAREKWPKKRVVMENTSGLEDSQHLSLPSLSRPESAMDCGISSGGSESGCECDFLLELDEEPLEGWVPVMVREDHHDEEGWVSLTGSWMLMGGPDDRKRNLRVVNV